MTIEYPKFGKIPRLHKPVVVTEKIDGTNGLVSVRDHHESLPLLPGENLVWSVDSDGTTMGYVVRAGSRNRWLTVESDNYGFARWIAENATQLATLGVGNHYGEWFGKGIQRGYGMDDRGFALFNVARWYDAEFDLDINERPNASPCPPCCTVVPVLARYDGSRLNDAVASSLKFLKEYGSAVAAFDRPEGLIVYHMAAGQYFKVLIENDDIPKGAINTVTGEILESCGA